MSSATPASCAVRSPKLSFVTMYAPPALGYALIVWRYENSRIARTAKIPNVTGMTSEKASTPTAGTATFRISSVA